MAVSDVMNPFVWGAGGRKLTPEEIAREREIAEQLLMAGADTSPVDHWMQGVARVAHGAVGALRNYKAGRAERDNQDWGSGVRADIIKLLGGDVGMPGPAAAALASASGPSPSSPAGGARAASEIQQPSALPASFLAAVDRYEGGGDYDTLFGYAQREGGRFAGTRVSQMPIGEVLAFADPRGAYGQSVKGQIGRVATPMGRHQIVGTTLRNAVAEMGLDPSQPFDRQTQDAIAAHLARRRIAGQSTMDGKVNALRAEWEGFKSVPQAQLAVESMNVVHSRRG